MIADGVVQMRAFEGGLIIPAGAMLKLAPGGKHLMVIGLDEALVAGGALQLTLEFAKDGPVDVVVPISAAAPAGADHSHH